MARFLEMENMNSFHKPSKINIIIEILWGITSMKKLVYSYIGGATNRAKSVQEYVKEQVIVL